MLITFSVMLTSLLLMPVMDLLFLYHVMVAGGLDPRLRQLTADLFLLLLFLFIRISSAPFSGDGGSETTNGVSG